MFFQLSDVDLALINGFERFALEECRLSPETFVKFRTELLHVLELMPSPPLKMIHIGCGQGELLVYLATRIPQGEFVGINQDSSEIAMAEHLSNKHAPKVQFRKDYPAAFLDTPDNYYNLVLLDDLKTLPPEHWLEVLKESARITAENGSYILFHVNMPDEECRFCEMGAFATLLREGVGTGVMILNHPEGPQLVIMSGVKKYMPGSIAWLGVQELFGGKKPE